jgi:hypothetical protein
MECGFNCVGLDGRWVCAAGTLDGAIFGRIFDLEEDLEETVEGKRCGGQRLIRMWGGEQIDESG